MSLELTESMNPKQLEKVIEAEMDKHLKHFEKELAKLRTGRAHPSLVEDIKINAYGNVMALKDLAAISAPEAQLLVIQPWDKTIIAEIEKTISQSDLGIAPLNDGNVIRLPMPKMSSARRDELAKNLSKRLEECKVSIRNVRKDFHNLIREAEKNRKISEDLSKRLQDLLQKVTDRLTDQSDAISSKKEQEIKSL